MLSSGYGHHARSRGTLREYKLPCVSISSLGRLSPRPIARRRSRRKISGGAHGWAWTDGHGRTQPTRPTRSTRPTHPVHPSKAKLQSDPTRDERRRGRRNQRSSLTTRHKAPATASDAAANSGATRTEAAAPHSSVTPKALGSDVRPQARPEHARVHGPAGASAARRNGLHTPTGATKRAVALSRCRAVALSRCRAVALCRGE